MNPATRHICLVVLLGLLVGHTSIAVHAATHVTGDAGECQLCITYGQSADTVETTHECNAPDNRGELLADLHTVRTDTRHVAPYSPRDPPLTD